MSESSSLASLPNEQEEKIRDAYVELIGFVLPRIQAGGTAPSLYVPRLP